MKFFAKVSLIIWSAFFCALGGCRNAGSSDKIRVAYFPNLTHAQPIVGLAQGIFQSELGQSVQVETKIFNAGPSAVEALFAGAIDMAYIGAGPAINAYVKSGGEFKIAAGAAVGGAALIVRKGVSIRNINDWNGKKIATPQIGNTQDIAARAWLKQNGLSTADKGGTVQVLPVANADQLTLFLKGDLDAAWTVEPWISRIAAEAGGEVYMTESELWEKITGGDYATTVILVSAKFMREHPELVKKWLNAHCRVTGWIQSHPLETKALLGAELLKITKVALPEQVMNSAFKNVKFTPDPVRKSLSQQAKWSFEQGFLGKTEPDLSGLCDLSILNEVLTENRQKRVE